VTVKTDEFGRASVRCPHCRSAITVSAFQTRIGSHKSALRRHTDRCVGATPEDRAHYRKHGSWPNANRKKVTR